MTVGRTKPGHQACDGDPRPGFFKQVRRTANDFQLPHLPGFHSAHRVLIHFDDRVIQLAHDEHRRRVHLRERGDGKVGTSAA